MRARDQLPGAPWTQRVLYRSARRAARRDALLELLPKGSVGAEWEQVRARFVAEIASGQVELHRALSTDAVREFLVRNPKLEPLWLGRAHQFLLRKP